MFGRFCGKLRPKFVVRDMPNLILFNKPFNVLCQFSPQGENATLAPYFQSESYRGFYAAGRLDKDSEGLLALTDDGWLQHRITDPRRKLPKTYWVQVEGEPSSASLAAMRSGVTLKDGMTRPAQVQRIAPPDIWPRQPAVRQRRRIPTQWLELTLQEGKNRQVRRMTAAIGHPTLRLIRTQIGPWPLAPLQPGEFRMLTVHKPRRRGVQPTSSRRHTP